MFIGLDDGFYAVVHVVTVTVTVCPPLVTSVCSYFTSTCHGLAEALVVREVLSYPFLSPSLSVLYSGHAAPIHLAMLYLYHAAPPPPLTS